LALGLLRQKGPGPRLRKRDAACAGCRRPAACSSGVRLGVRAIALAAGMGGRGGDEPPPCSRVPLDGRGAAQHLDAASSCGGRNTLFPRSAPPSQMVRVGERARAVGDLERGTRTWAVDGSDEGGRLLPDHCIPYHAWTSRLSSPLGSRRTHPGLRPGLSPPCAISGWAGATTQTWRRRGAPACSCRANLSGSPRAGAIVLTCPVPDGLVFF